MKLLYFCLEVCVLVAAVKSRLFTVDSPWTATNVCVFTSLHGLFEVDRPGVYKLFAIAGRIAFIYSI